MNFTSTPPTTPGFYAWRLKAEPENIRCSIYTAEDIEPCTVPEVNRIGEWCLLVPAEEVEKAFKEGYGIGLLYDIEPEMDVVAKRVMEGKE